MSQKFLIPIELSDEDAKLVATLAGNEPLESYLKRIFNWQIDDKRRDAIRNELKRVSEIIGVWDFDLQAEGSLMIVEHLKKTHPKLNQPEDLLLLESEIIE